MAEQEPELLPAADEGLGRSPQVLVRSGEELGDVVILLPGLRRRQVVAVLGLERLLLLGVAEQVLAIGAGMDVAVDGLGDDLAVPDHEPVAIDLGDVVPVLALADRGRHLGKIGGEVAEPGRSAHQHVECMLTRRHRRHVLGVELAEGEGDDVGLAARFLRPGLGMCYGRPADEGRVEGADGDLDTAALRRSARRCGQRQRRHAGQEPGRQTTLHHQASPLTCRQHRGRPASQGWANGRAAATKTSHPRAQGMRSATRRSRCSRPSASTRSPWQTSRIPDSSGSRQDSCAITCSPPGSR